MKKLLPLLLSAPMFCGLTGCAIAAPMAQEPMAKQNGKKVHIAYFSHTGNTRKAAEQIQALASGDLVETKTQTPDPTNYHDCTEIAKQEKETNARPKLSGKIGSMENYHIIFIDYPI